MGRSMTMSVGIVALSLCVFLQITASQGVRVFGANLGGTINMSWPWPIPKPNMTFNSSWPWPIPKPNVTINSSWPWPIPTPSGPLNYTVGDVLGWTVPPGGRIFYASWAHTRTFKVGDALVFLFINGTQDVAVVSKEAYENCDTTNTIAVYSGSPTRIVLDTTGEHYYTSTYNYHCALGQKLAINVTSAASAPSPAPSP